MQELEVSVNNSSDNPDDIRSLLAEYERHHGGKVNLQVFDWSIAWAEFMKISLYKHGPVISETGDTWMGSLTARNSLRPFMKNEVAAIGGPRVFPSNLWQSCVDFDNESVVAIPWLMDTYLIYYRRDLLKHAGVDEANAFSSLDNFLSTLERLQKAGIEIPLAIPTVGNSLSTLHNIAAWVWDAGGDFITPDGKQVLFTKPKTRAGMRTYFEIHRFMSPRTHNLDDAACVLTFMEGKAAITLRNPQLLPQFKYGQGRKDANSNVGVAVQPGVPVLGGSNLIIWNHIPPAQESAAVELVRYLTSADVLATLFQKTHLLPARLETLEQIGADPDYTPVIQTLKTGRAFKRVRMWGLVEDKLSTALNKIWQMILTTLNPNVDQIIADELDLLEERLNITLSQ